jgi:hypothetical protein
MLVLELFDLKMSMEFNYNELVLPGFRWLVTGFSAVSCDLTSCNFGPIHYAMFSFIFLMCYTLLHFVFLTSVSYGSCSFVINTC